MKPGPADNHTVATRRTSERELSLSDLVPAALGAAGVFIGPMVAHASLISILAGCAGGATFFGGSLAVLRAFGRSLVPAVLASAVSGAAGALVYWLLARPDLTAVGTTGLGAIAGAAIAPFQLIWVQFRYEVAQIEADHEFEYTGLVSTLWRALLVTFRHRPPKERGRIGGR
jgi:uncharacterized MnhB-related membrane protein